MHPTMSGRVGLRLTCLVEAGQGASCSGILVCPQRGYVLTHASLLVSLFDEKPAVYRQLLGGGRLAGGVLQDWPVQVTLDHRQSGRGFVTDPADPRGRSRAMKYVVALTNLVRGGNAVHNTTMRGGANASRLVRHEAHIQAVWRSDKFSDAVSRLFSSSDNWKFSEDPAPRDRAPALPPGSFSRDESQASLTTNASSLSEKLSRLLPFFVLIRLENFSGDELSREVNFSRAPSSTERVLDRKTNIEFRREMEIREDASDNYRSPNALDCFQSDMLSWNNSDLDFKDGRSAPRLPAARVNLGETVFVLGTPFGSLSPAVFMNSVARGVVSNVAGKGEELILTDARCIPGTEGGAIYLSGGNGAVWECGEYSGTDIGWPVGMVVAPLCWRSNEWVGLSIGCRLSTVLDSFRTTFQDVPELVGTFRNVRELFGVESRYGSAAMLDTTPRVSPAILVRTGTLRSVVLVQNGSTWGSGSVVCGSLVITCSHVVCGAQSVRVRVGEPTYSWFTADVVCATPPGEVYDLAVLKLRPDSPQADWPSGIDIAAKLTEGESVYAVGHAAFGAEHNLGPSVTAGLVSRVVCVQGRPVLIQTTCAVHAGASGGPLVNSEGRLLGVIVCNAKDTESGASYPHVNLAVPASALWPALTKYLRTGDVHRLRALRVQNKNVCQLWALHASSTVAQLLDTMKSKL